MLEIRLLGQFNIAFNGQAVDLPSRPAQSLLAYLVMTEGVAHRRERLAGLLWPDIPEGDARRNLRRALWQIRKAIGGDALLRADDLTVSFEAGPQVWVDALKLSKKIVSEQTIEELTEIVSAYNGELLPGFYDEWIIVDRERIQKIFENRIGLLLDRLLEAQKWDQVLEWGEHWIALTVASEPAYRALMIAYFRKGDLSGVGHTYRRCVESLQRDLGVDPSVETQQLYVQLSQKARVKATIPESHPLPGAKDEEMPLAGDIPRNQGANTIENPAPTKFNEPSAEPPFKGLQFFEEADSDLFFGREVITAKLMERLWFPSPAEPEGENILVVVGASGSGKSSLVRAGLVPASRQRPIPARGAQGEAGDAWDIAVITPSAHPLEILATRLTRQAESVTAAATLIDDMVRDSRSLRLFLHRTPFPLFLVVDQLEELFTLCRDEAERRVFVDNLLAAAEGGRCKVILTLRADFYAHCAQNENLRNALTAHQEYIGPMSAAELRRAIEEPARQNGLSFEPGLVDLILHEIGDEPGSLPLLSHALLETWKRRQDSTLSLSGYAEAGGVHGAIAHTAETVFTRLSPEQQRITRNIFLRLTEFGEGPGTEALSAPDTRRRVALKELVLRPDEQASLEEVLNLLVEARLVTVGEDSVEVAHEALIREWPTLRRWLSEDREGHRLHRRLTESAQSWEELECEPGELYRGARLAQAQEWASGHAGELNDLEREFLIASQALVDREIAEREVARQREVEAAQRFAESERRRAEEQSRSAQRFRWLAAGLAVLLLAAVALASLALQQRDRVVSQARLAASRELAASALTNIPLDPQRSILLSLQALDTALTQEAVDALHQSLQASRIVRVFKTHYKWAIGVVASLDGKLAGTSFDPNSGLLTEVWNQQTGERLLALPGGLAARTWPDLNRLATVDSGKDGAAEFTFWDVTTGKVITKVTLDYLFNNSVTGDLSPDWNRVAVAMNDGTTRVYDLKSGENLLTIGMPGSPPSNDVAFSPNGKRLITTVSRETALWDLDTGQKLLTLPSVSYGTGAVKFNWTGELIAVGLGNAIKMVDTSTGEEMRSFYGHSGYTLGVDFDKYSWEIAAGGSDSKAFLWNVLTGQVRMVLAGHTGSVSAVTYSTYQTRLASAGYDGTVRLWDVSPSSNHEAAGFFDSYGKPYTGIAYSPDGKQIALSGGEQEGDIFDATTGKTLLSLHSKFGNWLGSIAFSPDGSRLASTTGEKDAYIWDAHNGEKLLSLSGHKGWIGDLAYNPDGSTLATIGYDGLVKIWDPRSGSELLSIEAFSEPVQTIENIGLDFSLDGTRLATAAGYQAKIWDAHTGKALLALPAQEEYVSAIAFSPDGKRLAVGLHGGLGASVWDAATGQKLADLKGHQGTVTGILFTQDGKQVITGSVDGTVRVWDSGTGEERLTLSHQTAQITGIALSPDGTRLAASSDDGTGRVYFLRVDDLIQAARQRLIRGFTLEECLKYLHSKTCPENP